MTQEKAEYNFNSFNLILFIRDKFKLLAIITAIGAIASIVVSLSIEEKYRSSVILFPAASNSISKVLLSDLPYGAKDIMEFGAEDEAEQLLQILHSDDIKQHIVKKFDLMAHYNISPDDKYPYSELDKTYRSNINFDRTEFMSIQISVLDKDPQMAADIANEIAVWVDTAYNKIQKQRAQEAFEVVKAEYFELKEQMNELEDSLKQIRQKGVIDYESQATAYNEAYAKALAESNISGAKVLAAKMDTLAEYGGIYVSLSNFLEYQTQQLSVLKAKYEEAKVDATKNIPHKFVVNKAQKQERKAYPVRWLIVVVSTIATAVFALLALIVIENIAKVLETKKKSDKKDKEKLS